jgi:hypothetical protein
MKSINVLTAKIRKGLILLTLTSGTLVIAKKSYSQIWTPATNPNDIENTNTGKVGIGTSVPSEKLTVHDGNIAMPATDDKDIRVITANSTDGMLYIGTDVNTQNHVTNGPSIQMAGVNNSWRQGGIWYHSYAQNNDISWGNAHIFLNYNTKKNNWTGLMSMRDEDGYPKIAIGSVSSQPDGYSLFVQHGILTEKLKVAISGSGNWADYVFGDDYKLTPLHEVESFVQKNKHLPGMPSGQSLVDDGGIDVNQMFAKQMEKIEELTLYMIELEKQVKQLKSDNLLLMSAHPNTKN